MIGLLQRVSSAAVSINNHKVANIGAGLLLFIGIEKNDTQQQADRLLDKILAYRVFPDQDNKMNLSLSDIQGGLLLVPQFTLPADTKKGLRPSFSSAATPELGEQLFDYLLLCAKQKHDIVEAGKFGADMQVSLTNDGPVTFWLQIPPNTETNN
jgi:D-tyrosyl-tRNA(Tyr) deacylase